MRQISRGVEDIHWQNSSNVGVERPIIEQQELPEDLTDLIAEAITHDTMDPERLASSKSHTQHPEVECPHARFISDQSGVEDVQLDDSCNSPQNLRPEAETHVPSSPDSDSVEKEKGLKRKMEDRGASQAPPDIVRLPSPSAGMESVKRLRDDADKDDNPRETKRPSPPPENEPTVATPSTPTHPTPQLVRTIIDFGPLP